MRESTPTSRRAAPVAAVILAVCAWGWPASADVTIGFDPPLVDFNHCDEDDPVTETVAIDITVDAEAVDLRGMSIVLDYEPTFVEPILVEAGSLLETCDAYHVEWLDPIAVGDSTINVDAVGLGCSVDGPGAYIRITFENVGADDYITTLGCRSVILRDSENVTLPHVCGEGTIRCTGPVPTEEGSWTTLKARFRTEDAVR